MNSFISWGTFVHELIRILCLKLDSHEAFKNLCTNIFCLKDIKLTKNKISITPFKLQKLTKSIYRLDGEEKLVASCYSVSLTIFYLAELSNHFPTLIIGARRVDERLHGHAWVRLKNGSIINPGNEPLSGMQILHEWNVEDGLDVWARGIDENMVNRIKY